MPCAPPIHAKFIGKRRFPMSQYLSCLRVAVVLQMKITPVASRGDYRFKALARTSESFVEGTGV